MDILNILIGILGNAIVLGLMYWAFTRNKKDS